MTFEIVYAQKTIEVFQRAKQFCKKNSLAQIEPVIFFRELLREADSTFYEYLQAIMEEESCEIEEVLEESMKNFVTEMRQKRNRIGRKDISILILELEGRKQEFKMSDGMADIIDSFTEKIEATAAEIAEQIESMETAEGEERPELVKMIVYPNAIMREIIGVMPNDVAQIIRQFGISVSDVQATYFDFAEELENGEEGEEKVVVKQGDSQIPPKMRSFLKEFTSNGEKLILGRDKETKMLWDIISKKKKRNAILVGEPGVGKTALIHKMAQDIANGECPEKFKDYKIIALDINDSVAGTMYRGQAEERFSQLRNYLEQADKVILFIDEIHTMLGAGSVKEDELDLANSLKPILAEEKVIVIGATTNAEYERCFARDGALKRRFEKVEVKEPKNDEVYDMIKNQIASLEKYHEVSISKSVVEFAIFMASCFNYETRNPDRTLDLLDRTMVVTKNAGVTRVTEEHVLENFNVNFKQFDKMPLEEKKALAYHEAGHFVVTTMSGKLKDQEVMAISIMPADDYMGVNIIESTDETVSATIDYYIDLIAARLAGREAERKINSKDNAGATSDLADATKIAYQVVTKMGLIEGYKMAYIAEDGIKLVSEKTIDKISEAVQNLLCKAEVRAKEILEEHENLLVTVADKLLEKKMISKRDLEKIMSEVSTTESK